MIKDKTTAAIKNTPAKNAEEQEQKNQMLDVAGRISKGILLWPANYIIANRLASPIARYPEGVCPVDMTAINAHCLVEEGASIDEALKILGLE